MREKQQTNCRNGLDFEHEAEDILTDNGIPFMSQVDFKNINARCDVVLFGRYNKIYNLSIKRSLRERYKLSAFEQVGLQQLYGRKAKTYIVTNRGREAENLIARIPKSTDLKNNLAGVIYIDELADFVNGMRIVAPKVKDKRITRYHATRSNLG